METRTEERGREVERLRDELWAERIAAGGLGATTAPHYHLGWDAGFSDAASAGLPLDVERLRVALNNWRVMVSPYDLQPTADWLAAEYGRLSKDSRRG